MRQHGSPQYQGPATESDLRAALLKLARSIDSATRAIDSLRARLKIEQREHEEGEKQIGVQGSYALALDALLEKPAPELNSIRNWVVAMDYGMDDVLADIRIIRAHMDVIANDAYLRDEFKRWLAPKKKGQP